MLSAEKQSAGARGEFEWSAPVSDALLDRELK
jgi:hypothetical protein